MTASKGLIPEGFAAEWIAAWNAHDLDRILAHYAEDAVFRSPIAAELTGAGIVEGKAALRAYWTMGLDRSPDLQFELETILLGSGAITLLYRNHRGQRVAETCEFDQAGRVIRSVACYASLP